MTVPDKTRANPILVDIAEVWQQSTLHFEALNSTRDAYLVINDCLAAFGAEADIELNALDRDYMRKKLIQCAAMCLRAIVDLGLDGEVGP